MGPIETPRSTRSRRAPSRRSKRCSIDSSERFVSTVAFEVDGEGVAEAREWFSVPLAVIDEAIELISAESVSNYEYDLEQKQLRLRVSS